MTTLSKLVCVAMFSIGLSFQVAQAAPGDVVPGGDEDGQPVALLNTNAKTCAARGGLCIKAGSATTRPVAEWLAGAAGAPISSDSSSLFLRVIADGPSQRYDAEEVPWTLDVSAAFRQPALAGNTLFILTDVADPQQSAASHLMTALYQTPIGGGDQAAVRLSLSPQDGFRAGHTYRLRIVQLIAGKEVELSTGEIGLL